MNVCKNMCERALSFVMIRRRTTQTDKQTDTRKHHVRLPDVMAQDDPVPGYSCHTCAQVRIQADVMIPTDRIVQTFQSSDAVRSHQKKHSLSLRLTAAPAAADPVTETSLLVPLSHGFATPPVMPSLREEMPTPRRFLKEFERNSAFLDDIVSDGSKRCIPSVTQSPVSGCIAENPFAETFRRASFSKEPVPVSHELKVPDESESLNTPSIQLNASQENPLSHPLSQRCLSVEAESVIRSPLPHLHHKHPLTSVPSVTKPAAGTTVISPNSAIDSNLLHVNQSEEANKSADFSSNDSPEACVTVSERVCVPQEIIPNEGLNAAAMPVQCEPKTDLSCKRRRCSNRKKNTTARKVGLILPKPQPSVVSLTCLPLPSTGIASIPAVIPVTPPSVPTIRIFSPSVSMSPAPIGNPLLCINGVPTLDVNQKSEKCASTVLLKPGRKKKGQETRDEQEKRVHSLDRNREAAQRSRMKRKRCIQEVEDRAELLADENRQLQVSLLY